VTTGSSQDQSIEASIEANKSSITKAIKILAKEYLERLTKDNFGRASDTLTDKSKALAFIA
jgi:hypothetical protein